MALAHSMRDVIEERINSEKASKVQLNSLLHECEINVNRAIQALPQKPNLSAEEIDDRLRDMEEQLVTGTTHNEGERKLVASMKSLKKKRQTLAEYEQAERQVQLSKDRRQEIYDDLKRRDKAINELVQGLRKLELVERLEIDPSQLFEDSFEIPDSVAARVVGKNGSNLKNLEQSFSVSVSVDKFTHIVTIIGPSDNVTRAKQRILLIAQTLTEDFNIPEELAVALTLNHNAIANQIMEELNCRIDVGRVQSVCRISALPEVLATVKERLASIDVCKTTISFESLSSGAGLLLGKGGANFKTIEANRSVMLDLDRDRNCIHVLGLRENVGPAILDLNDLISASQEVTETVQIPRNALIISVLGSGGKYISEICRESGARIEVCRTSEGDRPDGIKIKGTRLAVTTAKRAIADRVGYYNQHSLLIPCNDSRCLKQLIGKSGSIISALRDRHPGLHVSVELDLNGVEIFAEEGDEEHLQSLIDEVKEMIRMNEYRNVVVDVEVAMMLKGQKGNAIRTQITQVLHVFIDIDVSTGICSLRGPAAQVSEATSLLEAFQLDNCALEQAIQPDDEPMLWQGGDDCLLKLLEGQFNVDVRIDRSKHSIKFRGSRENAEAAMKGYGAVMRGGRGGIMALTTSSSSSSSSSDEIIATATATPREYRLFDITAEIESLGIVIGKSGSNIKRLEETYGVSINVIRPLCLVRVHGLEPQVLHARRAVLDIVINARVSTIVPVSATMMRQIRSCNEFIDALNMFHVSIEDGEMSASELQQHHNKGKKNRKRFNDDNDNDMLEQPSSSSSCFVIRGSSIEVNSARVRLLELISGRACISIPIYHCHSIALSDQLSLHLTRLVSLAKSYGVNVTIVDRLGVTKSQYGTGTCTSHASEFASSLCIEGPLKSAYGFKISANKMLFDLFPHNFYSFEMKFDDLREIFGNPITLSDVLTAINTDTNSRLGFTDIETFLELDRISSCIRITIGGPVGSVSGRGRANEAMVNACRHVSQVIQDHKANNSKIVIDDWMVRVILGQKGQVLRDWKGRSGASIEVIDSLSFGSIGSESNTSSSRSDESYVRIYSDDPTKVSLATALVSEVVNNLRGGRCVIRVPQEAMGLLIGKSGSSVRQLQADCEAFARESSSSSDSSSSSSTAEAGLDGSSTEQSAASSSLSIDTDKVSSVAIVRGSNRVAVQEAKRRIEEFVRNWSNENYSASLTVESSQLIGAVLGVGGETAGQIESANHVRIDANRQTNVVTIRGLEADVKAAKSAVEGVLRQARTKAVTDESKTRSSSSSSSGALSKNVLSGSMIKSIGSSYPDIPPGAPPALVKNIMKSMKSTGTSKQAASTAQQQPVTSTSVVAVVTVPIVEPVIARQVEAYDHLTFGTSSSSSSSSSHSNNNNKWLVDYQEITPIVPVVVVPVVVPTVRGPPPGIVISPIVSESSSSSSSSSSSKKVPNVAAVKATAVTKPAEQKQSSWITAVTSSSSSSSKATLITTTTTTSGQSSSSSSGMSQSLIDSIANTKKASDLVALLLASSSVALSDAKSNRAAATNDKKAIPTTAASYLPSGNTSDDDDDNDGEPLPFWGGSVSVKAVPSKPVAVSTGLSFSQVANRSNKAVSADVQVKDAQGGSKSSSAPPGFAARDGKK